MQLKFCVGLLGRTQKYPLSIFAFLLVNNRFELTIMYSNRVRIG
jgi:hypothetical protein